MKVLVACEESQVVCNGQRINHACGNCIGKQRCRRKNKSGRVELYLCPHSSRKAEADCEYFVRRVKKE